MNKLLLTLFLGFDYIEFTQFVSKSPSIDFSKNKLKEILLPDLVKVKNNGQAVTFIQNLRPRFESEWRQIYFVYKIESTLLESNLENLETRYFIDGTAKIQSFVTSFFILSISAFLFSQEFLSYSKNIIAWNTEIWFFIVGCVVIKVILGYFIYADIEDYKQKLTYLDL